MYTVVCCSCTTVEDLHNLFCARLLVLSLNFVAVHISSYWEVTCVLMPCLIPLYSTNFLYGTKAFRASRNSLISSVVYWKTSEEWELSVWYQYYIKKKKKKHKILLYIAVHRCRWLSVSVHPRSAYFGTTISPSKNRVISFYIQFILLNLFFSIPKKVVYWRVLATSFSENYSEGKWRLLCLAFYKLCR